MGYVYMVTNTKNQKKYIGISIYEPENGRIRQHLSGRGSRLVSMAVKKYGQDVFTYEILEANVFDQLLPDLEIAYIANFNTVAPNGYNLDSGGGGGAIPSIETRRKMSKANKGKVISPETRRKISETLKNREFSPEHCRKLSEVQKGKKRPNMTGKKHHMFGKTHTPEARRKISEARKTQTFSEETRRKISEAGKGRPSGMKGKKHSLESRRRISESNKGEKHPNYGKPSPLRGKPLSPETRRRISEANKGKKRTAESRRKISEVQKGRKRNPEAVKKTADALRGRPKNMQRDKVKIFFDSLPPNIPISNKRSLIRKTFPNISNSTILYWTGKWQSETETP